MKSSISTLIALLLGVALLNACGEKKEEAAAPAESASAPAAVPAAPEPVKEEAGGWVPPPADAASAIPAEAAAADSAVPATPAAEPAK
jgi:hypothetical protein